MKYLQNREKVRKSSGKCQEADLRAFKKNVGLQNQKHLYCMGYSDSTKAQDRNSQGTKAQNRNIQSILTVKKKQLFGRRSFVTVWRSSPSLPNITVNVHLVAVKRCVGIVWAMR